MKHDIDMTRQGVSKHLDVLEEARLVTSTRRGRYKVLEFAGADRIQAATTWLSRLSDTDTETEEK